jgi:L-histidine N-alpha-methyltransferase
MQESHNAGLSARNLSPPDRYLMDDVLQGLSETPKRLSPIWFYDERGSQLFDQICELPEYYPTLTELAILRAHIGDIAAAVGSGVCVIEPGSGTSLKTRLLLERLHNVVAYVPVDIAGEHLVEAARQLRAD